MTEYLRLSIEEHAEYNQSLSEIQRTAEKLDGCSRKRALEGIWERLISMEHLKDFMGGGRRYGQYRYHYFQALSGMRKSLTPQCREE